MSPFAKFALPLSLTMALGLAPSRGAAEDTPKPADAKPADAKDTAPADTKDAPKPADAKDAPKPADAKDAPKEKEASTADAPIPKEVMEKLEIARKAVAEAIVAAEDAGLVNTTVSPPPIFDILVTGRANDAATLKAGDGASPEVFGAWWSGQGKPDSGLKQTNVRIVQPVKGLRTMFDQRAVVMNKYIEEARKAKDAKKDDAKAKADEEAKKANEEKAKAEADAKAKADDAKKADAPKADAPKADDAKKEEPKADDAKKDEPKADEAKKDEPK